MDHNPICMVLNEPNRKKYEPNVIVTHVVPLEMFGSPTVNPWKSRTVWFGVFHGDCLFHGVCWFIGTVWFMGSVWFIGTVCMVQRN